MSASGRKVDVRNAIDREIAVTRVFDAPREMVFESWIDPEHISNWWGPHGFSTTTHEMDVRPGGVWRLTMHGPDGTDYDNKIVFVEVVKPERIVYDHVSSPEFRSTVTFEEQGGKTKLTLRMLFDTADERDRVIRVHGALEGAKQMMERLARFLPPIER